MSGKPWPEGVTAAMALIETMARCEAEMPALNAAVERLKEVNHAWSEADRDLSKLLNSMDVSAGQKGNLGWEARFGWFLQEMVRQAKAGSPASTGSEGSESGSKA